MWEILKKGLWGTCTFGATISISALSLIGMYFIAPSLWLCLGAFVLAGSYEGQVNSEGIRGALDRMFNPDHLRLAIIGNYLDKLDETNFPENIFLKKYKQQKKYVDDLEKYISDLKIKKQHYLKITHFKELEKLEKEITSSVSELKKAQERLRRQKLFVLKELYRPENEELINDKIHKDVGALLESERDAIKAEISRKAMAIRSGWFFSFSVGTATGLASLSAIQSGMAAFGLLSLIPGGMVIGLATMAAVGYALLMYQTMSDMIEDFELEALKNYFKKRTEESRAMCIFRCVLVTAAILLGIVATLAMAGTWYRMVRDGASLLTYVDRVAYTLRDVLVAVTALPNLIFTVKNSVDSAEDVLESQYLKLFSNTWNRIERAWTNEVRFPIALTWTGISFTGALSAESLALGIMSLVQFANPFRAAEKIVSTLGPGGLFMGHVSSIGVTTDHIDLGFIPGMPPINSYASGAVTAASELATDLRYMPNEKKHTETFILLKLLFLPLNVVTGILKCFATMWDYTFSPPRERDFKKSCQKIFTIHCEGEDYPEPIKPQKPEWSEEWGKQEVLEICDEEKNRLMHQNPFEKLMNRSTVTRDKIKEFDQVKADVVKDKMLSESKSEWMPMIISKNRNCFCCFHQKKPGSQNKLGAAIATFHEERGVSAAP